MFNLISTLIKTTVFVTVGIAGFSYLTKPSDESLGKTISKNAPFGIQSIIKITSNNITEIDDYVFFKTARFAGDNKISYLGIVNHWLPIKK